MAARVHAPELTTPRLKLRGRTPARDAFLRENAAVDHAILAVDLGLDPVFVLIYMRKLGLRTCQRRRDD